MERWVLTFTLNLWEAICKKWGCAAAEASAVVYSNSIVEGGLLVTSYRQRATLGISLVILSAIRMRIS